MTELNPVTRMMVLDKMLEYWLQALSPRARGSISANDRFAIRICMAMTLKWNDGDPMPEDPL